MRVYWVPGAFEIPLVAKRLAASGTVDAVICLGAVVRGETAHFEYVAGPCASGVARGRRSTPASRSIFGVLTTDDEEQALDGPAGARATRAPRRRCTAIEMVRLLRSLPSDDDPGAG